MIGFFVPGVPKSTQTGSVVVAGGRSFPLRRGTDWSGLCGLIAASYRPPVPLDGPLRILLVFFVRKPRHPKHRLPITRPDLGNLSKGPLDAFQGVLFRDDAHLVDFREVKVYERGFGTGVFVQVEEIEDVVLPDGVLASIEEQSRNHATGRHG